MGRYHYVFPRWSNLLLPSLVAFAMTVPLYVALVVAYGASPRNTDVGYQPVQPIPYSHKLHAGDLGIDCRYCHNTVESSAHASIPPTRTCMNCHIQIVKDSPLLEPLRVSYETGTSVPWTRIHDLPDYAYFSHAAHVNRGVSCVSCHGRVDRMEIVSQQEPLSMGWCLACHRAPDEFLRDPALVTDLAWEFAGSEESRRQMQQHWRDHNRIQPSEDCSTCHR